ncbi:MAG: electron transfer flavoprotein subunit alpha/FixB family protein [Candidatus Izemoplasmatales bacterium]|nr:electron transfer flavoprotein subunit alpha/FixB family protein [Candidatus Izemoplasmatales bacterium]
MTSAKQGVLVFIEQRDLEIQKVSYELLGAARILADKKGVAVTCALLGSKVIPFAEELVQHGADIVYVCDDPLLQEYVNEPYTKALTSVIRFSQPQIVLIGATAIGRDLAPRVSSRIHTGLTADCTQLDIDEETGNLLMTRPAFGGNLMATIVCPDHRPQMSTVRPGVMIAPRRNENAKGEIILHDAGLVASDMNVEILEIQKEKTKKINIEEANVLVSAGRGIGSKDHMGMIYELADLLKGEVSGSRAVIETGWLDKDRQVGQTGKTVRPDVYFACGISGAIQHVSGMEESGLIIAINKNKMAPIFEVADIGIVGDASKVIPELVKEIKIWKENA